MIRGYIDRENYNAFSTYKKSLVKFNYLCFLRGTKSINEQIVNYLWSQDINGD